MTPDLSVEFARDRAELRYNTDSAEVSAVAQEIIVLCRPRVRRWTKFALGHAMVAQAAVVVVAAVVSLLVTLIARVELEWWHVPAAALASMALVWGCRFLLRRLITHAVIRNHPEQDQPGFLERNKDALMVASIGGAAGSVVGAVVATILTVLTRLWE